MKTVWTTLRAKEDAASASAFRTYLVSKPFILRCPRLPFLVVGGRLLVSEGQLQTSAFIAIYPTYPSMVTF
jgi:hypothetical protein